MQFTPTSRGHLQLNSINEIVNNLREWQIWQKLNRVLLFHLVLTCSTLVLLADLFKVQPLDLLPITVKDCFQKANNIYNENKLNIANMGGALVRELSQGE